MLARWFDETSVVADDAGELAGFILGYQMPPRPESVFVWQVTTADSFRGQGLATRMMGELLRRHADRGGTHLEATVTPSNSASQHLFRGVARRLEVPCVETLAFERDHFPVEGHEEEVLYRIGPFDAESARGAFPAER